MYHISSVLEYECIWSILDTVNGLSFMSFRTAQNQMLFANSSILQFSSELSAVTGLIVSYPRIIAKSSAYNGELSSDGN